MGLKEALENACDSDKRFEWNKVEGEFKSLKKKLTTVIGIDHTGDLSEMQRKFSDGGEKNFFDNQEWILMEFRESDNTSGGSSNARVRDNAARKESMRLPPFKGDEKMSPYLKFPVWKKQWDILIDEYDEKWRAGLLWDHIDDGARSKFIGWKQIIMR